ncbi:hypothetical protein [Taibaiella chishuiensis]|uniref:PXPV repeat-containing protein n=1 Tax=Taibaiella chishuiensis TaxID=1434707 RepID=A0A2P8DD75_9BACT|nr:hypothetical protein [Taibaiella chishuiensis]PSK95181.1 hypothetical protein B0I18_1011347 [Taibaiella chishuiensis]
MKKHIFFTALFVLFGLFFTTAANAQGHGWGRNKHYYKEQRRMDRAYAKGYRDGYHEDRRYVRRHRRVAYYPPVYRPRPRYYRPAPVYAPPPPRPYYRGGVSINIPLPPLPPHP